MVEILKRKPCNPSRAAVPAKRRKITVADTPHTSVQAPKTSSRLNLTLSDWMTVYGREEMLTAKQATLEAY